MFKLRSCSRLSLEITSDAARRGKPQEISGEQGLRKEGTPKNRNFKIERQVRSGVVGGGVEVK